MNTLTKIAIVVLVLLTTGSAMVLIQQATARTNWKAAYENEHQRNADMAANLQAEVAKADRTVASAALVTGRLESEKSQIQRDYTQTRNDLATKEIENSRLLDTASASTTTQQKLQSLLEMEQAAHVAAAKNAEDLRTELGKANESLALEQTARRKLVADLASAQQLAMSLREQIDSLQQAINDLQERKGATASTGGAAAETPATDVQLSGTITGVKNDLVSMNVGSAKGVKAGMVLVISRGEKLVSRVRVQDVDTNESAGIVFDKQVAPVQGDIVASPRIR